MKSTILLLAVFAAALSSCTTAYKTGQTPDDVYFSPARPQDEYVQVEKEDNTRRYRNDDEYYDDRYLRMKVHNRTRWNVLDDWYDYERYGVRGNYYYGTYNNPYNSWNYYYNPYCYNNYSNSFIIVNPKYISKTTTSVKPRNFSLNSYSNSNFSNTNINSRPTNRSVISRPVYNNSNSLSNTLKQIFSGSNNNSSNSSNNSSSRTYTPTNNSSSSSSSGSSSSSSSGSSGGSVSRPSRGN